MMVVIVPPLIPETLWRRTVPSSFYSYSRLLSYNAIYNFAVGGRGVGKTYGWQKKVTKDAIRTFEKNPELIDQFIYVRRYKEELKLARDTFFAAVYVEFPDYDFKVQGFYALMSPASERDVKKRPWHVIGYFIELSRAQSYKSVAFPLVKTIGFDEFIIEKSATHYLPNEAVIFNNFYSTVDRYKDKTRVFFMANSVSITNPYFLEWDINPNNSDKNGFVKSHDGFMVAHFIDSEEFNKEVYQTKFGKFIQGSDYAEYAVGNQFSDNHSGLLRDKGERARYMFTLETTAGTFSIWFDIVTAEYFCQGKRPRGDETMITLIQDQMDEGKTLMRTSDDAMSRLRTAFNHGRVWFDTAKTRNSFLEIYRGR